MSLYVILCHLLYNVQVSELSTPGNQDLYNKIQSDKKKFCISAKALLLTFVFFG